MNKFLKYEQFAKWLVGIVDGDGTFYFGLSKIKSWSFSFQVAQSSYNLRLLFYIKHKLKVGSISIDEKNDMAVYRIRDKNLILKHIIPLFDRHPLLTCKHYKYIIFKEALLTSINSKLSFEEKNIKISKLKTSQHSIPINYKSPVWLNLNKVNFQKNLEQIVTKSWVIGFVEAEGSFYITKKDPTRLVHTFEITQKTDKHVLEAISLIFKIKTGVRQKKTYFSIVSSRQETIQFLISYFFKTMKGMKSLEYRIWARSYNKKQRGFKYLENIREKMRNIRAIRFSKDYKKFIKH